MSELDKNGKIEQVQGIADAVGMSVASVSRLTRNWSLQGKFRKVRVGKAVEIWPLESAK